MHYFEVETEGRDYKMIMKSLQKNRKKVKYIQGPQQYLDENKSEGGKYLNESAHTHRLIDIISQRKRNDMEQKMYRINEQLNLIYTPSLDFF